MNTPCGHHVRHGSSPQYIDKNCADVFIVWDRLFGTFEEERGKMAYGVKPPLVTASPVVVFLHGFARPGGQMAAAKGSGARLACLRRPPG